MLGAKVLDDKHGQDIRIIDVGTQSSFADYFVMSSGGGERQIDAQATAVEDAFAEAGLMPRSIEGKKESGWILMDYGDVIVNILTKEMRERYNIENVWGDCETIYLEDNDEREVCF